jgi:hypothetical protein
MNEWLTMTYWLEQHGTCLWTELMLSSPPQSPPLLLISHLSLGVCNL